MIQSKWVFIRLAIVSTGIIQGLLYSSVNIPLGFPSPWLLPLFALTLMPILYFIVIAAITNTELLDDNWYPPQWHRNPFTLKQPFQFFHMLAWQAIATGLTICLRLPWMGSLIIPQALLSLAFGTGILIGIRITMRYYQGRRP